MTNKPKVKLTGTDGNAFAVLGKCKQALRKAQTPQAEIDAFLKEAMAGDYNELLATCMKYCDVS